MSLTWFYHVSQQVSTHVHRQGIVPIEISCATVFSRQLLLGQSTSVLITLITPSGGQEHNVLTITTEDGIYLSTTVSVPTAHWLHSLQAHVLHMTVLRVDCLKQGRYLESCYMKVCEPRMSKSQLPTRMGTHTSNTAVIIRLISISTRELYVSQSSSPNGA